MLYEQSGCDRSARPSGLSHYSVARYTTELEAVRAHLGYDWVILAACMRGFGKYGCGDTKPLIPNSAKPALTRSMQTLARLGSRDQFPSPAAVKTGYRRSLATLPGTTTVDQSRTYAGLSMVATAGDRPTAAIPRAETRPHGTSRVASGGVMQKFQACKAAQRTAAECFTGPAVLPGWARTIAMTKGEAFDRYEPRPQCVAICRMQCRPTRTLIAARRDGGVA